MKPYATLSSTMAGWHDRRFAFQQRAEAFVHTVYSGMRTYIGAPDYFEDNGVLVPYVYYAGFQPSGAMGRVGNPRASLRYDFKEGDFTFGIGVVLDFSGPRMYRHAFAVRFNCFTSGGDEITMRVFDEAFTLRFDTPQEDFEKIYEYIVACMLDVFNDPIGRAEKEYKIGFSLDGGEVK